MKIVFYDVKKTYLYTYESLSQRGVGGTEGTIVRLAHKLKNFHTILVAQGGRSTKENSVQDGVHYVSLETAHASQPDVVIVLRERRCLESAAKQFSYARLYYWMHNIPSKNLSDYLDCLIKYNYQIIAVSHFHRKVIERRLRGKWYHFLNHSKKKSSPVPIHVMYNPVADDLQPNNTVWNPNQLISISTPHKGLEETLALFQYVSEKFPDYRLLVATYKWNQKVKLPNKTEFIGSLPHPQLIQCLRESFCVFYPQPVRIETFGLVYAESNAVGTPVLADDIGAASEVLSHPSQLVNGHDANSVLNKLIEWRKKRPTLTGNPEFKLSNVTQRWLDLLGN